MRVVVMGTDGRHITSDSGFDIPHSSDLDL